MGGYRGANPKTWRVSTRSAFKAGPADQNIVRRFISCGSWGNTHQPRPQTLEVQGRSLGVDGPSWEGYLRRPSQDPLHIFSISYEIHGSFCGFGGYG